MKINPELKAWFIKKNKEHILEGVRQMNLSRLKTGVSRSSMVKVNQMKT